tara:strand:- start:427 stop:576 length:150 start_codon:yes stop_codon:yes gene_type:complete
MNKKGDTAMPIPLIMGLVIAVVAAIIIMVLIANNFGLIDIGLIRGISIG